MNTQLIDNLRILADYERINKEPFKVRAYEKVIDSIELYDKKIEDKIVEFLATGNIAEVENVIKDPKYILGSKLKSIYGVGPAKITELMTKIKDFEELREHPELFNDKQRIGLKYYDQMNIRIPMAEGKQHYKSVKNMLDASIEFEFVGSFRRKNKDMGDIDILIKDKGKGKGIVLKDIIKRFVDEKYVIEKLALGNNKFMGLCRLGCGGSGTPARRIDILLADPSYYYFALLYFTGSYNFNIYMRKVALSKGLSLSEYGFKDSKGNLMDTTDIIHSEEDIFAYLDIPYTEPHKR